MEQYKYEKWLPVFGFEDVYSINIETGEVKSVDRTITDNNGKRTRIFKERNKKIHLRPDGYCEFYPWKNNNGNGYLLHIAIWESVNGKVPDGYEIHHKNHNRADNRLENLCLVEKKKHFEMHKEERTKACIESKSKPVLQYTKDGQFIAEYKSGAEASRKNGIPLQNINDVCNCKVKTNKRGYSHICRTAGGFIWKKKEDD